MKKKSAQYLAFQRLSGDWTLLLSTLAKASPAGGQTSFYWPFDALEDLLLKNTSYCTLSTPASSLSFLKQKQKVPPTALIKKYKGKGQMFSTACVIFPQAIWWIQGFSTFIPPPMYYVTRTLSVGADAACAFSNISLRTKPDTTICHELLGL